MAELELMSFLPTPAERFLSKYLKAARFFGVYDNAKLFERWPSHRLMQGYADEPKSRAAFIGACTRMPAEYVHNLSIAGCVEVLEIARGIDSETNPDTIFKYVTCDEMVRTQDVAEIYAFLDETAWDATDTTEHRALAAVLLAEYVAGEELAGSKLAGLHAIEKRVGIEKIVRHLPIEDVVRIVQTARDLADTDPSDDKKVPEPFTIERMNEIAPTDLVAKHVPIPDLMRLIRDDAQRLGFIKPPEPPKPAEGDGAPSDIPAAVRDQIDPPTVPPPAKTDDDGETILQEVPLDAAEEERLRKDAEKLEEGASGSDEPVPGAAASNEGSAVEPPKSTRKSKRPPPRAPGEPPPLPFSGRRR